MIVIICPSEAAPELAAERSPSHVLALAAPGDAPAPIDAPETLALGFNDIAEPRPGLVQPQAADIAALLGFALGWNGARPLLVHCRMGVSRSTAAAFAIACQARPKEQEERIAQRLRRACPVATPNPLMVALADVALGRGGRMVAAIQAIGRGADYAPYRFAELWT